jgi:hypothetical protein
VRPRAVVSVDATAFGGFPAGGFRESSPYNQVFQDWAGWLRDGWVDAVFRMGYKRETEPKQARDFRAWADFSRELQSDCPGQYVTLGIGGYLNSLEGALAQYAEARKRGLGTSLFSYHRPIKEAGDTRQFGAASPFYQVLSDRIYTRHAPAPAPRWRERIGIVIGTLKDESGRPADGATVSLAGTSHKTRTDGSGVFAFSRVKPGSYTIAARGFPMDGQKIEVRPGTVTRVEAQK